MRDIWMMQVPSCILHTYGTEYTFTQFVLKPNPVWPRPLAHRGEQVLKRRSLWKRASRLIFLLHIVVWGQSVSLSGQQCAQSHFVPGNLKKLAKHLKEGACVKLGPKRWSWTVKQRASAKGKHCWQTSHLFRSPLFSRGKRKSKEISRRKETRSRSAKALPNLHTQPETPLLLTARVERVSFDFISKNKAYFFWIENKTSGNFVLYEVYETPGAEFKDRQNTFFQISFPKMIKQEAILI